MDKSTLEMPAINLVRKKGVFIDAFLHWALTTGRFIIIITETVALAAFAMRFSLDSQIINLHDKIKQEQAIINLLKHNEGSYRNVQDRLSTIQHIDTQSHKQTKAITSLLTVIPDTITVNTFSFFPDKLQLDIDATSTTMLDAFIKTLTARPDISGISIDKIANNISQGVINVTLTANLK